MIVFIIGASFLFIALDWKYLEYKYGIKIFPDELCSGLTTTDQ